MDRFIIFWSLISPGCFSLIVMLHWSYRLTWHPGYPEPLISVTTYLLYWLLLGILQGGILFWKFQNRQFAYRWFFITSTTGFFVMLLHDLSLILLNIDTGGQGVLILLLSLPPLAILGGFIVGLAQFLLIRKHRRIDTRRNHFNNIWFTISFLSWAIGFTRILFMSFGVYTLPIWILLVMGGSLMKGWFIHKYLRRET